MLLGFLGWHICYSPVDAGGGGGTGTVPTGQTGGDPGSSASDPSKSGQAPTTEPGGDKSAEEKKFSQADLDAHLTTRLAEEKRRNEGKAAADKKKADDDALAKNAEWQKLAETRGTEIEVLKAQAELAVKYSTLLNKQVDTEVKGWPKEVSALDPGPDNVEIRLSWLEKSRDLAAKLAKLPTAPATEGGQGNKPGQQSAAATSTTTAQPGQRYRFQNPGDVTW